MELPAIKDRFRHVYRAIVATAMWFCLTAGVVFAEELGDVATVVRNATQLEDQDSWKEAVELYKKALKQWPEQESLTRGLRRSQFQFAVSRRYADKSFTESLKPMQTDAAFTLYEDVLTNIQTYYVDPINTTSLVAHGTESLWLALGNDRFVDQNLFGASPERIESLRRQLFETYWNKPVSSHAAARQMIQEVATVCQKSVGLSSGAVIMEYVFGACNCLDDYSSVLTPGKREDLYGNIKGEFVGIGIVMEAETGKGMKLHQILPESPANEQGLKRGDYLVSIDGKDCRFLPTDEAANLLTGKQGSRVVLEVSRNGNQQATVTCTRREVKVKSVPVARIIDSNNGIGYIQMTGFQQSSVVEMDAALNALQRQGMKKLVWDLRENPGGLLDVAVEVLDRFIDEGVIVSTRGRSADQNMVHRAHSPGTWKTPLVLLIDENSASASEIVAGAIRDHHRGTIVGRTSFGKWSVQSIYNARYETGMRLTTAKFYSPNGDTWGKIGLQPDITVKNGPESRPIGDVDLDNDPDLQEALRVLQSGREITGR